MKTTLIVGSMAAAALAAVPILSAFAATSSVQDNFSVTLVDSCAFDRTGGDGNYSVSINPGGYSANFASSVFTVTCNTPDVYTVTAEFSDLSNGEDGSIAYSIYDPTGAESAWTAKLGESIGTAVNVTSGEQIMQASVADGGATATVRYSVGAASDQDAGTYSGYAKYTLVSGS
ncbi:hypothetical protein IJG90_03985 [Candidatus Saccharibacteria bacterium]|nr:hypothetical protein [Candidatus Saccharibacteria bacterium]